MSKHYRVTQLYVPDGTPLEPYLAMLGRELAPGEKAVIWRAPGLKVTVEVEYDPALEATVTDAPVVGVYWAEIVNSRGQTDC